MNIVLFGEVSTETVIGGAERMLREQAIGLRGLGCDVSVVSRAPEGDRRKEVLVHTLKEHRYEVSRRNETSFVLSTVRRSLQCFDAICAEGPVDVGIIHQSLAGLGPVLRRRTSVRRWIYMCLSLAHEEFVTRQMPGMPLSGRIRYVVNTQSRLAIERAVMQRCDRIVVMSQFMRDRVQAVHKISDDKLRVIPGASDLRRFHPPDNIEAVRREVAMPLDKLVLFTVRNLVPRMGLENLIQAIANLGEAGKGVLLVIGGEGPLGQVLKEMVERLDLHARVRLVGFIPEDLLPKYYQAADLVVMPTHQLEGFGLVTVEALACGTPVLGTPVGAIPEILSQIDPLLIAEGVDASALTKALLGMLKRFREQPQEKQRLGEKGRALVERLYTWEHHTAQLASLFREIGLQIAA